MYRIIICMRCNNVCIYRPRTHLASLATTAMLVASFLFKCCRDFWSWRLIFYVRPQLNLCDVYLLSAAASRTLTLQYPPAQGPHCHMNGCTLASLQVQQIYRLPTHVKSIIADWELCPVPVPMRSGANTYVYLVLIWAPLRHSAETKQYTASACKDASLKCFLLKNISSASKRDTEFQERAVRSRERSRAEECADPVSNSAPEWLSILAEAVLAAVSGRSCKNYLQGLKCCTPLDNGGNHGLRTHLGTQQHANVLWIDKIISLNGVVPAAWTCAAGRTVTNPRSWVNKHRVEWTCRLFELHSSPAYGNILS
jgi:hypothetical protein